MLWEVVVGVVLVGIWSGMASVSGAVFVDRMSAILGGHCVFQQLHSVRQEAMAMDEDRGVSLGGIKVGFKSDGGTQFAGTVRALSSGNRTVPVSVGVGYGQVTLHAPE